MEKNSLALTKDERKKHGEERATQKKANFWIEWN